MVAAPRPGRFTVLLAALVVAVLVASTFLLVWHLRTLDLKHAQDESVSLSHLIAEQTTRAMQSVELALDVTLQHAAAAMRMGIALDDRVIHNSLHARVEVMPQLRSIFIADSTGRIISSALSYPAPAFNVADRAYFLVQKERQNAGLFIDSPTSNRVDQARTLFVSRRISSQQGEFLGVIVASLDITHFESLYKAINLDDLGPIGLFMSDGAVIALTAAAPEVALGRVALPALGEPGKKTSGYTSIRDGNGVPGVTTYRRVGGYPLVVGVGFSDASALGNWREIAVMVLIATLGNILIVILATGVILRRQWHEAELEQVARRSSDELAAIVRSAMDAIITVGLDHRIVVFNPAAQSMFGQTESAVLGKPVDMLLPERLRGKPVDELLRRRLVGETAQMPLAPLISTALRSDGSEFPIEATIAQVTFDDRPLFSAILRDISDRQRAEDELRNSYLQVRSLATSLQAVREEERTAIARELHDELGQQLLRLRMDLSWLAGRMAEGPTALRDKLAEMKQFLAGTVDALRQVTSRLRPPMLDDLGLAAAAKWQVEDFASRTGIRVKSSIAIPELDLDQVITTNVFRILQESLTNVYRHSGASEVYVSLSIVNGELVLDVSDNGRGIEHTGSKPEGHGLVGIRERALMLRGSMAVESAPGEGLFLRVCIPIRHAAAEENEDDPSRTG